jgi:hypothetical protein
MYTLLGHFGPAGQFEIRIEILIVFIIISVQYFTNNLSYFYYNTEQNIKYQYFLQFIFFYLIFIVIPYQIDESYVDTI